MQVKSGWYVYKQYGVNLTERVVLLGHSFAMPRLPTALMKFAAEWFDLEDNMQFFWY